MRGLIIITALCSLLIATPVVAEEAYVIDLGKDIIASDVSDDGTIVVGVDWFAGSSWMWTADTGVTYIGGVGSATISKDGSNISGTFYDVDNLRYAGLWQGGTTWLNLGGIGGQSGDSVSSNYDISADGSMVVGLAWVNAGDAHAFSWTQATGMVDLGALGGESSRANSVSGDGRVIVGWDQDPSTGWWRAAKWVDGVEELMNPGTWTGMASATNSDGSIIVGQNHPDMPDNGWLWTETGGFQDIGLLPGWMYQAWPEDLSETGDVVVGACGFGGDRQAFIWTEDTGMVSLNAYLNLLGIHELDDIWLDYATACTSDGEWITATGYHTSTWESHSYLIKICDPDATRTDIKCNGEDEGVIVNIGDNATLTIDVFAGAMAGVDCDVWVLAKVPSGKNFSYGSTALWKRGWCTEYLSGPLPDIADTPFDGLLPPGSYKAWLGIDNNPDGNLNIPAVVQYDMVDFQIVP